MKLRVGRNKTFVDVNKLTVVDKVDNRGGRVRVRAVYAVERSTDTGVIE